MLNKNILLISILLMLCLPEWASGNENVPVNEAPAIRQIEQLLEVNLRAETKHGLVHRGAHGKSHGCVKARFKVLNTLHAQFKVGIFGAGRDYSAWIRYSNGSGKIQDDAVGDARGMAIKLMGNEQSSSGTQDFVMINHPVFFVRNAADFLEFQKALAADSPAKFFFPDFNPFNFRLHEFSIVNSIQNTTVENLLAIQYWSMTPYRFGNKEMKFSARPCAEIATPNMTTGPDFLRENLQKQLAQSDACFDFLVQLRNRPSEMPIEDPTLEWREQDSPFIPVAQIIIPAQSFATQEQVDYCENLSFTPWHAIPDFQPLGGINRVRKSVYDSLSRVRHELNGVRQVEPTDSN